jgi:hypothetical protein
MGHAVTARARRRRSTPKRENKRSSAQIENIAAGLREWAAKRPTRAQIEQIAARLREWAAQVDQST